MAEEVLTANEQEWKPKYGPWISAMPTIFAAFMCVLDTTIANVALPHMAGSFSATRDESIWILTSYLVSSGIIVPTVDWFCRLVGRKNFFMISIILFVIASFCCGISQSIEMMILARIFQGVGGGGILPISQAILLENFPKEKRGLAMAVFGLVIIIAPVIGPVLGGWITDNWTWPWIFFINIPVGFLALYLSNEYLEDPPYAKRQKGVEIDFLGFLFLIVWIVCLQIVLDKGNNADWFNSTWVCWTSAVSALSAILFVITQLRSKNPLIDLSVFKDINFSLGTFIQMIIAAVLFASLAILPQFLQSMMGYDAFLSGLSIMPRGLGSLCAMAICGWLSTKIDNRLLVLVGLVFLGTSGFVLGSLNLQISSINIVIPNFMFGFGMGFSMIPLVALSVVTLKNEQMTNACGVQNLLKNISGAIGTSLVSTMITRYSQVHQSYLVESLNPLNPIYVAKFNAMKGAFMQYASQDVASHMAQYSLYGELLKQSTLWGFIEAFRIFAIAAFVIIPLVFLLRKIK